MPSTDAILAGLAETANTWRWLAIWWHVVLVSGAVAFLSGAQLSNRLVASVAVALVACVSAISLVTGNPFNAIVFAGLAILLAIAAGRAHSAAIQVQEPRWAVPGTC
jgi:hypothetical protein